MARSRRVLPIGAACGTIREAYSEVVVSNGSSRDHGSIVSGDPSGSVTPRGVLQTPL